MAVEPVWQLSRGPLDAKSSGEVLTHDYFKDGGMNAVAKMCTMLANGTTEQCLIDRDLLHTLSVVGDWAG